MSELFIGGVADGRRINVPEGRDCYDVPEDFDLSVFSPIEPPKETFRVIRYKAEKLYYNGNGTEKFYRVFVIDDGEDVLSKLIKGYKASE